MGAADFRFPGQDIISGEVVEPVMRATLGAIDVLGGPTERQLEVLKILTEHLLLRPDLDPWSLTPLGAEEAALTITSLEHRRRFLWLAIAVMLCRGPLKDSQVAGVKVYGDAFGIEDDSLAIMRAWMMQGAAFAAADLTRYFHDFTNSHEEHQLQLRKVHVYQPDEQMLDVIESFETLPEGTLGQEFLRFHQRHGLELPGLRPQGRLNRTIFLSHDMNHVITGYEPTPAGEIALAAMSFAAGRCQPTWAGLLLNLAYHEGLLSRQELSSRA
ncbi:MAG: hypothetical protein WD029_00690, partial [Microthrixaceae bacterium]